MQQAGAQGGRKPGPQTSTEGGAGGGGTTRSRTSRGSSGAIIRPQSSAHARDERGRGEDGTADVDRRRCWRRRDDPIVNVAGERRCDDSTIGIAGVRRRNNLTVVVSPLSMVGRMALPLPPAGSGGAFFAVPPPVTVLQANTAEDNKDNCACAEDARNKQGHGEDASRDCGRQQEEAPAEEGQPNRGRHGGVAA